MSGERIIDGNGETQLDDHLMSTLFVGLPTLNSEQFLPERIKSIVQQSYGNFKVFVIDGGSSDQTLAIINDWAACDERVVIHSKPVSGIYNAFNLILNLSDCEYTCILTADDTMATDFFEQMIQALNFFPTAGLAASRLRVIDELGNETKTQFLNSSFDSEALSAARPRLHPWPIDGVCGLSGWNPYISQTQLVYRTTHFRNQRFHPEFGITADILFNLESGLSQDVVHVYSTWAAWRRHQNQASQSTDDSAEKECRLETMIQTALTRHFGMVAFDHVQDLNRYRDRLQRIARLGDEYRQLRNRDSKTGCRLPMVGLLARCIRNPRNALFWLGERLFGPRFCLKRLRAMSENIAEIRLKKSGRLGDRWPTECESHRQARSKQT